MDSIKVLSRDEVQKVLAYLHRRHRGKTRNNLLNLVMFRLSCCCGLRVKEIAGLKVRDVITSGEKPAIFVTKHNTKGREGKRRGRLVPLSWDAGTLADLERWQNLRRSEDYAGGEAPFLAAGVFPRDKALSRSSLQKRWRRVIARSLGDVRAHYTGIHQGRHTFCTHALYSGRSLAAVQRAAGHRDISMTAKYLHFVEDLESKGLPDVFATNDPS